MQRTASYSTTLPTTLRHILRTLFIACVPDHGKHLVAHYMGDIEICFVRSTYTTMPSLRDICQTHADTSIILTVNITSFNNSTRPTVPVFVLIYHALNTE